MDNNIIIIGIMLSLIYYEMTDLSPGGIIVPAYLSLYMNNSLKILITLVIATITYLIIGQLSKIILIFGRRRFTLMIVFSFIVQIFFREAFLISGMEIGFSSIGVIIPGIMASDFEKQGYRKTTLSLGIVMLMMYFILKIYKASWGYYYG